MPKLSQIAQASSPPATTDFLVGVTAGGVDQLFSGLQIGAIPRGINTQTVNYTLVLADAGKIVEMNVASANTLTIPPNSSVAFPIGTVIPVTQVGAGVTTITAGAGVTLDTASAAMTQWVEGTLYKRGTNEWVFSQGGSGGGGGGSPGGSNTDVQFNNSSAFGGDGGFTYGGNGQVSIALGSITANKIGLNLTATWNNAAVNFDAPLFMNITNTASGSASKLFDFQVGSTSFISANSDGSLAINQVTGALTGFPLTISYQGSQQFSFNFQGVLSLGGSAQSIVFNAVSGEISWGGGPELFGQNAWNLALVNLGNPLGFRVYNTTDSNTSPTNYERGVFDWVTNSNILTIGVQAGGTGTLRNIEFVQGSTNILDYGVTAGGKWTFSQGISCSNASGIAITTAAAAAFYNGATAQSAYALNSSGSDFGQIGNFSAHLWYLGFGASATTIGTTCLRWSDAGSVIVSQGAAIATNATDGFLYIPTCAGAPTGVPTTQAGTVALVWDTTNHKFWVYDTAWKGGTTPGAWT